MPRPDPAAPALRRSISQPEPGTAHRVLIIIDSFTGAEAIADWLSVSRGSIVIEDAVVLSVLPPPEMTRTRGIFAETVRRHISEAGEAQLVPLRAILAAAGTPHVVRVELIDNAEAVDRIARELGCKLIVMSAAPSSGARKHWLSATGIGLPSLATRVAEISECPTLVIKHRSH